MGTYNLNEEGSSSKGVIYSPIFVLINRYLNNIAYSAVDDEKCQLEGSSLSFYLQQIFCSNLIHFSLK